MKALKYTLEKVVISGGYGNREADQIKKIKDHLESLLSNLLKDHKKHPKVIITTCVRPNAVFKIKKGKPVGIKVTLRKAKAHEFIRLLAKTTPNFIDRLVYNNNTLFIGLEDHKKLKLERYKYDAPEYGFNVAVTFNLKERKPLLKGKHKKVVPKENCLNIVSNSLLVEKA